MIVRHPKGILDFQIAATRNYSIFGNAFNERNVCVVLEYFHVQCAIIEDSI